MTAKKLGLSSQLFSVSWRRFNRQKSRGSPSATPIRIHYLFLFSNSATLSTCDEVTGSTTVQWDDICSVILNSLNKIQTLFYEEG